MGSAFLPLRRFQISGDRRPEDEIDFFADDIEELWSRVKDKATVVRALGRTPWGSYKFVVSDPDGCNLGFVKRKKLKSKEWAYVDQKLSRFCNFPSQCGLFHGRRNSEGIFSVLSWSWNEAPPYETPVRWHTGDPETDPWEWRIRVLEERDDIAYAKLFFNKSGYITKEWYPYFLAARRGGRSLMEEYEDGKISYYAKRIYDVISNSEAIPLHEIKQMGGFSREDSHKFDRALVELQSKMFVTMCGSRRKISKKGEEYGWSSTVFCTVERFFGEDVMLQADKIDEREATEIITQQICRLNPAANPRRITRFIKG